MKIKEMFSENKTVFSFEVFPPKKTSSVNTIYNTLEQLQGLTPDFISVTYGAGGNVPGASTCEIASAIKYKYGIESVAHLPCINFSKSEIIDRIKELKDNGIENILALRGDINPNVPPKQDFKYASEMIEFIRQNDDSFDIAGACYPEGHVEAENMVEDIKNLKKKVESGADHLISQLFFDNNLFYQFIEKSKIAGIDVPIEAGIMPVVNKKQIERMVSMCGTSLPSKFTKMMQKYENHPDALRDAGIAYAVDQIVDLISHGVDGIHLYTMNNPYVARKIRDSISELLKV